LIKVKRIKTPITGEKLKKEKKRLDEYLSYIKKERLNSNVKYIRTFSKFNYANVKILDENWVLLLLKMFKYSCAYCESKITLDSFEINHFRPTRIRCLSI